MGYRYGVSVWGVGMGCQEGVREGVSGGVTREMPQEVLTHEEGENKMPPKCFDGLGKKHKGHMP